MTERPDVLVMDIQMPGLNGIEATREIAPGRRRRRAVLMLTMFDDDESLFAAMRAGAVGYVLKGAAPDSIIRAITAVAAGEAIFSPGVARADPVLPASAAGGGRGVPRAVRARAGGARPDRRRVSRTPRSPAGSCCRRTRSATTSRASSPSCRWRAAPRRSSGPAARASADFAGDCSLARRRRTALAGPVVQSAATVPFLREDFKIFSPAKPVRRRRARSDSAAVRGSRARVSPRCGCGACSRAYGLRSRPPGGLEGG